MADLYKPYPLELGLAKHGKRVWKPIGLFGGRDLDEAVKVAALYLLKHQKRSVALLRKAKRPRRHQL